MPEFVANNITIISGFMYGIDSLAHLYCLDLGGTTIAVLGSGLNCLYPPENDELYSRILDQNGLVISQFEPDFKATIWSFPQRNKTVVKLSTLGVLVVEAGLKSGSLITANLAKKFNKPLFALPGPITSSVSIGTNELIKSGDAQLVTSASDVLSTKQIRLPLDTPTLPQIESNIIDCLKLEPLSLDELSLKLSLSVSTLSPHLSSLSLKDLIEDLRGKFYLKNSL
ncbi:DNA-protecting protein DprA [Patescibacteria group bacterium]|nr:DNA-protecting protein DprA [Patescibacteria group bacterium]